MGWEKNLMHPFLCLCRASPDCVTIYSGQGFYPLDKWIHRLQVSGFPCMKNSNNRRGSDQQEDSYLTIVSFAWQTLMLSFSPFPEAKWWWWEQGTLGYWAFTCLAARLLHLIRRLITRRPNISRKKERKQHWFVHKQLHCMCFVSKVLV